MRYDQGYLSPPMMEEKKSATKRHIYAFSLHTYRKFYLNFVLHF